MNILISPLRNGHFYFRSDSTLIRALTDFYIPDYVDSVSAVPVLCFRSERSGKSVPARFAPRYMGPFTCGIIIKADINTVVTQESDRTFIQNALDYSTVIPYDLIPIEKAATYLSESRPYIIKINGLVKSSVTSLPSAQELYMRFENISRYCSVRTGDFIAFELDDPVELPRNSHLTADFGIEGRISVIIH
ncbi:MAG TPA: hypothetical protein IAC03_02970 [Candidatus Coprenecus pullistercoris]|nr:hypothetical protein [Candidatus Coprenecus pullistercoris]